ncbi:MAG: HD domain-containing phosphohydrolase [Chloroflexota bacterium]
MEIDYSLLYANANILVVDDTAANLALLTRMLKDCGYIVRPVPNGRLALQAARGEKPDLILLDISMPEMDGYEVCQHLKRDPELKDIPVLFISALSQTSEKIKAFEVGGVDYITKPFHFDEVKARVETHLKLHRLQMSLENQVEKQVKEIIELQMGMIFGLAKLAEARDNDTGRHLERIQILCKLFAEELLRHPEYAEQVDSTYCDRIFHASPLHDIGKVGIADNILLKPGKLTPEEFEIMKTHALIGAQTLEAVQQRFPNNEFLMMGITIARSHHEKWNGQGYPDGLSGETIPLSARIMAIVDVYDAVRSKRVYKSPATHQETFEMILRNSGTHFDPALVKVFVEMQDKFNFVWSSLGE